ncbi:FAD-dependent oxidoreductase [Rothia sp. BD8]|uniref:protoporphyrinogen/coproporphyrinogen oxidase n=1 Tax=Rothia TaxID=32207 RepID=UPI000C268928|nr:FAD-dependent oxidoreductase [Rothia kristinae]MCA1169654.1 FAD-dependent oxidoreductase [Rothia kristinae]TDP56727.1 oxygen-dependent protoporphyrinogen oxidase [Kocuria sp. AG109]WGH10045.1 FAD-dependent oxidoreductase [Rothia kristinae]
MPAAESRARRPRTALVIGGGIAGLVAARELAARGLRTTVLERREHFGGVVAAHELAGLVLDSGAESFATRNDAVPALLGELGLAERIVRPRPTGSWLHLPAGSVPMPASGILGIPGNPLDPALTPALGRSGQYRAGLDRLLPARVGAQERTLGGLVRARMGRAVAENLVAPVTTGIHSTDPDELDADTVAPGLRAGIREHGSLAASAAALRAASPAGSQVAGIEGGMNQLSEALVADLTRRGVRLVDACEVLALDRDAGHGPWMAIRRQRGAGDRSALRADVVVVAADGPTAVRLLGPHLPPEAVPGLAPGPRLALATLVVRAPALDDAPRGTGVLVSEAARDVRAKALTHANAKWAWIDERLGEYQHVLRLSYGRAGGAAGEEVRLPDGKLAALALHDAARILGVPLSREDVLGADVVRWDGAMPSVPAGHRARAERFRSALAEVDGAGAVGAWLAGTGLASVVPDARRAVAALDLPAPRGG